MKIIRAHDRSLVLGFVHTSLTTAPASDYINPAWTTTVDMDYAGLVPSNIVRIGNGDR